MAKIGSKKNTELPSSHVIQVNPYEIPERTLQVTTRISTASSRTDAMVVFDEFTKKLLSERHPENNILLFLSSIASELSDKDFWIKLRACLQNLKIQLEAKDNTKHTLIVVAGGFSSGKSTFINSILGEPDLLPTDIDAASVVPTYLYCSKSSKQLKVKGVNFKNAVVRLDRDVLKCIQHGSKSNACISPLLKRLLIEIHSDMHDGIAYIDTPGYNNFEKIVDGDEKTDRQTAINTLKEGNVLFWVCEIEEGVVSKEDREIIEQFSGKIVIIFNKADTKTMAEIEEIILNAKKDFNAKSKKTNIIDIIAYSGWDNRLYYSMNGYSMPQLLKKVKSSGTGQSEIRRVQKQIDALFDSELEIQRQKVIQLKELWNKYINLKDKANRAFIQNRESNTELLDSLKDNHTNDELFTEVKNKIDLLNRIYQEEYENYRKCCSDIEARRKEIIKISNEMARFKNLVSTTVRRGIKCYLETVNSIETYDPDIHNVLDVFESIKTRDMDSFLDCFSTGLDIIKTQHKGYTPLTYAVKYGENDMVKFLLAQGANMHVYDGRGYNAFLTAVENNYKDLCLIMLDLDASLLNTKTKSGETAFDIARKHNFESWLNNKQKEYI